MNKQKISNIIKLSATERYFYFIRKSADFEKVWGLYKDNGWATGMTNQQTAIPLWPEKIFASIHADSEWSEFVAKPIPIDEFIKKWIPGAKKDKLFFAIFPTPNDKAILTPPDKLLSDLSSELDLYD